MIKRAYLIDSISIAYNFIIAIVLILLTAVLEIDIYIKYAVIALALAFAGAGSTTLGFKKINEKLDKILKDLNKKKELSLSSSRKPPAPLQSNPLKGEVTASTPESGRTPSEEAFDSLIKPLSIIIPLTWVALFSYLQFGSFSSDIKTDVAGAFLIIILAEILLFMVAILMRLSGYFKTWGSKILTQLSFVVLVDVLLSAPLPLVVVLAIAGKLDPVYIPVYLLAVGLGPSIIWVLKKGTKKQKR